MTPEKWREIEAVVDEALRHPGAERARFLLERCGADRELLEQALDLLLASGEADELQTPAWPPAGLGDTATAAPSEPAKTDAAGGEGQIGSFRVLRELGRGGMGSVFLAEQTGAVERKVALKVSHRPLGAQGRLRLAAERQAMARLSHPNIAAVLEAGSTDEDHPYFAMEWIDGLPICRYADTKCLGLEDRIRLFLGVCAGVQHAHQKGVLHRDLKPSNILVAEVDGAPSAKIIDFGIAKGLDGPLVDQTLETGDRVIGTPVYLSPEALSDPGAAAADTRGDVYSLGVVLQELLMGQKPFTRDAGDTPLELLRLKVEQEPTRASTLWHDLEESTREVLSRERATDPRALGRRLRGDLDWILLRALARDPERRYSAVSELAADLERHLADEPVTAGPPTLTYQLRKLVRRHRASFAFAVFLLAALIGGFVARTVESQRANREAQRANAARLETEQVVDFLVGLFESSDANRNLGEQPTAAEILAAGVEGLEQQELDESPTIRARLLHTAARVYRSLGDFEKGLELSSEALALRRQHLGPHDPDRIASLVEVGKFHNDLHQFDRGVALLERALAAAEPVRRRHPSPYIEALKQLSSYYQAQYLYDQALELDLRTLEAVEETYGPDAIQSAPTLRSMAWIYSRRREHERAEQIYLKTLEIQRQTYGDNHPYVARTLSSYGNSVGLKGETRRAIELYRRALEIELKVLGSSHPEVGATMSRLANSLRRQGHWQEAEELLTSALEIWIPTLGERHSWVATASNNLGILYWSIGKDEQAVEALSRALAIQRLLLVDTHPHIGDTLAALGAAQRGAGRAEAASTLQACRDHFEAPGSSTGKLSFCIGEMGFVALDAGRLEQAESLFDEARTAAESSPWRALWRARVLLGDALLAHARGEPGARDLARSAAAELEQVRPPGHRDLRDVRALLVRTESRAER